MDPQQFRRNIFLYQVYVLLNEPLFWGPIVITSMQRLGQMTLPEIYFMEACVLCICVLWDIPSGALADVIGRRRVIVIGRVFLCVSSFFFTTMTRPLHAWIANICWAIGFTMQSGADSAFLYGTLKKGEDVSAYKQVQGRAVGNRYLLVACTSLMTGFLADVNLRLPLMMSFPLMFLPLLAAYCMTEPVRPKRYSILRQLVILRRGWRFFRTSTHVRWMIGFAALLTTTEKLWFFTYNPYFEHVRLPLSHFGIVFFLLNIVAFIASRYATQMERGLGERGCILLMIGCTSLPILIMASVPVAACSYLVLVQNVVRGFKRPFAEDYLHRRIGDNERIRATIMSTQSSAANLLSIIGLALFGQMIAGVGLLTALGVLGTGALLFGVWSYRIYMKRIR